MLAIALLIIGACLSVAGAAIIYWPSALVVAGLLALAAGTDLTRS